MYKMMLYLLLALIILTLAACKPKTQSAPLTPVTLTLDWTPNTNHTGLYVALDKGYYRDCGLDVKIMQPGQGYTDQLVASGKSELGVSFQENVTRARSEDIPLISIAAILQHNTSGFASLKSAHIQSPKDFAGKRYGSWDSPSELAILKAITQKAGADFSKVKVVSGITDFFATIGRDADIEWIYWGWEGIQAQQRKLDINFIPLRELDPVMDYYTPVLITSDALVKTRPALIKSFLEATEKGYQFCIAQPDSAAAILLKHAPELNPDLVKASQTYLSARYQEDSPVWGWQKPQVWKDFGDWMQEHKLLSKPVDTGLAFTNRFLPKRPR